MLNWAGIMATEQDVLAQVHEIDRPPDSARGRVRLLSRERRISMEVGRRVLEHRVAKRVEPLDVPMFDVGFVRVHVYREVEEVRYEHRRRLAAARTGLQHVQPFDDDDVRLTDQLILTGNDVIREMRIDRRRYFRQP